MLNRAWVFAVAALAAVATVTPARASTPEASLSSAVSWLGSQQAPSGAFSNGTPPADGVAEAAAAVLAAGGDRRIVERALAYVREHGPERARERAGAAARIVLTLVAAGEDPRTFGGVDYVAAVTSRYDPITGAYDRGLYAHGLSMLGVLAAKVELGPKAIDHVRTSRCGDGGFSSDERCLAGADTDTTALMLIALARARASEDLQAGARAWLAAARNDDGGFGAAAGGPTNANSTGLALSALDAIGESPFEAPWSRNSDPVRALIALQGRTGAFAYMRGGSANLYATVQAIAGLATVTKIAPRVSTVPAPRASKQPSQQRAAPERTKTTRPAVRVLPETLAAPSETRDDTPIAASMESPPPARPHPLAVAVAGALAALAGAGVLARRRSA